MEYFHICLLQGNEQCWVASHTHSRQSDLVVVLNIIKFNFKYEIIIVFIYLFLQKFAYAYSLGFSDLKVGLMSIMCASRLDWWVLCLTYTHVLHPHMSYIHTSYCLCHIHDYFQVHQHTHISTRFKDDTQRVTNSVLDWQSTLSYMRMHLEVVVSHFAISSSDTLLVTTSNTSSSQPTYLIISMRRIFVGEHQLQRSSSKECAGASICQHQRRMSMCKDCGDSGLCDHDHQRQKNKGKECGGSCICWHDRMRQV